MTDTRPGGTGSFHGAAIRQGIAALGETAGDTEVAQLAHLVSELARWNRRINLTAIRDENEMVAAHVLDSLSARRLLEGTRILDVGTGGGFPGLPLAIVSPQRSFTLLDSNGKKISFVRHMIGELGLTNVEAVKSRVESFSAPAGFDTVIARAFAALPKMLMLTGHLVGKTGVLLALKGKYPAAELEELHALDTPWNFDVTELTVPGMEDHERHAIRLARRERA